MFPVPAMDRVVKLRRKPLDDFTASVLLKCYSSYGWINDISRSEQFSLNCMKIRRNCEISKLYYIRNTCVPLIIYRLSKKYEENRINLEIKQSKIIFTGRVKSDQRFEHA